MNTKVLKKFLRKNKCLRWYKNFLRKECFPPNLYDNHNILWNLHSPFLFSGTGYSQRILNMLKIRWGLFNIYNMVKSGRIIFYGSRRNGKSFPLSLKWYNDYLEKNRKIL